jgi:hypothetical protein
MEVEIKIPQMLERSQFIRLPTQEREQFLCAKHLEMKEIKEAPSNVLSRHL